jgi:hypothetical protein
MTNDNGKPGGAMFRRFIISVAVMVTGVTISLFVSTGYGQSGAPGSAIQQPRPFKAVVDLPKDSPEALQRKTREIMSWTPTQSKRLEFALKGVTRIVMFSDLGLGDRMDLVMPGTPSKDWPIGTALKLRLGREKTAVVVRIKIDTVPAPRVQGEGFLSIMGIMADTTTGRDIELQRTMGSTGRLDFFFKYDRITGASACCDLPTQFGLARYGNVNDTLTAILTFDPAITTYLVSIIGPIEGRTFPGFSYSVFRTERGEFHRELNDYPYTFRTDDSSSVNLYLGSRFRGRKSQLEPVLKAVLF